MALETIEGEDVILVSHPIPAYKTNAAAANSTWILYALTKNKAYILKRKKISQSSDVSNATATIVKKTLVPDRGTVAFIEKGDVKITFEGAANPDLIVGVFTAVRNSLERSELEPPSHDEDNPKIQERELWTFGPVKADKNGVWQLKRPSMGFLEAFLTSRRERTKVRYVITNKRAMIVSPDRSRVYSEVRLRECAITAVQVKRQTRRLLFSMESQGSTVLEIHGKVHPPEGNIYFIKEGKPLMVFEKIPNAQDTVDMINSVLRQS